MINSYYSYAREHHMGKYTLVAKNTQGHAVSNCDLIVRKKQFPPVFWKRLYNYETASGSKIVAEIEVGGWPVPEISWYELFYQSNINSCFYLIVLLYDN